YVGEETRNAIKLSMDGVSNIKAEEIIPSYMNYYSIGSFFQKLYIPLMATIVDMAIFMVRLSLYVVAFRIIFILGMKGYSVLFKSKKESYGIENYEPEVTVLVPVYNEEENIASTLISILNNNYSNYEV